MAIPGNGWESRYDWHRGGDSNDTLPYAVARKVEYLEALIQEAEGSAFVFGISSGGVRTVVQLR